MRKTTHYFSFNFNKGSQKRDTFPGCSIPSCGKYKWIQVLQSGAHNTIHKRYRICLTATQIHKLELQPKNSFEVIELKVSICSPTVQLNCDMADAPLDKFTATENTCPPFSRLTYESWQLRQSWKWPWSSCIKISKPKLRVSKKRSRERLQAHYLWCFVDFSKVHPSSWLRMS